MGHGVLLCEVDRFQQAGANTRRCCLRQPAAAIKTGYLKGMVLSGSLQPDAGT
ncbi:hypothetical protein HMPREF9371_2260 [Neisseria shayeganii 871]|uniref:Uncharacterized protein n=1 Tax=Neisseria shayeganii 871 TaxID=1032488 RepID=G4CKW9_9NEIS|nr:hypothetical protein HMPREF9371_2260 [Neisseria shayeganii 871]